MKNLQKFITISVGCILLASCSKEDFLNTKPDQSLVVPATLKDFQALLDNDQNFNGYDYGQGLTPAVGEGSSDNIYVAVNRLPLVPNQELNMYVWKKDVYTGDPVFDWNIPYRGVFAANVVLDGILKLRTNPDEMEVYNNIKGSALFYRAHIFYQLAQVFAPAWIYQ